jgi:nucleoid-associated protein YgaU
MQTSSNSIKHFFVAGRAVLTLAMAALVAAWLWSLVTDAGRAAAGGVPLRPDEVLTSVVATAALAATTWLALGVLLELGSLVPGAVGRVAARLADAVTPTLVRRTAGALLGIGLVAGLAPGAAVAAPAHTVAARSPLPDPGFAPAPRSGVPLPDPGWMPAPGAADEAGPAAPLANAAIGAGWVPSRPLVRAQPDVQVLSPAPHPGADGDEPDPVVVHRGDSLWAIAARHLGRDASDAEIASSWPAWFEANRAVIGDDPDALRPGQVLRPPEEAQS